MDVKSTISKASELIKSRSFEQAIPLLKDLISTDTDNELALGMLASVYAEIQMNDKAMELYERILAINPANPLARFQLGLLNYNNNQFDQAIEIWTPALSDEKNFMAQYFTGLAYLQIQQPKHARPLLEMAQQYMPTDNPLYSSLNDLLADKQTLH